MFIIGMIIRLSGSSRSFISPFLKCFTLDFDILNRFCLLIEIFLGCCVSIKRNIRSSCGYLDLA